MTTTRLISPSAMRPALINAWQKPGANVIYCTSRKQKQADHTARLLLELGFSGICLLAREGRETYGDLVAAAKPDILFEDEIFLD